MEDKIYIVLLHTIGFTHKQLHLIFWETHGLFKNDYFLKYKQFYNNLSYELLKDYNISGKKADFILKNHKNISIESIKQGIEKRDTKIIDFYDDDFPEDFKNISQPPFVIYVRGALSQRPRISIVGARKMTEYGKQSIMRFTPELGKYFDIVSGWAAWCDSLAHKIALDNNIPTVSIIGTGINQDYPTWNKKLYDTIVKNNGAIISIFPLDEPGNPYNFPVRNQLVAAYAKWLLVIEAKEKSGSLITTQLALDLGKDVFAIPWDISKITSQGCNSIIQKSMAKLTIVPQDILEEYNVSNTKINSAETKPMIFDTDIEEQIYTQLLTQLYSADEIALILGLEIKQVLWTLSKMEIRGQIIKIGASKYQVV